MGFVWTPWNFFPLIFFYQSQKKETFSFVFKNKTYKYKKKFYNLEDKINSLNKKTIVIYLNGIFLGLNQI